MSDDLPDGARERRYATDPASIRHEEALRALAVANLRAWTASRPGDELDVMAFEIDAVAAHPDEGAGFVEEAATMLGSLYVQLAEAVGSPGPTPCTSPASASTRCRSASQSSKVFTTPNNGAKQ